MSRASIAALLLLGITAVLSGVLAGCGGPEAVSPTVGAAGQTIRQIGSTTVLPLAEEWRAAFNAAHPEVDIAVSGGGSGTGINALISGSAEIANSSRPIKPAEVEAARAAGVRPVEHVIAYDGLAVIVNPANPVDEIPMATLSDIYVGRTRDWSAVGAPGLGEIQVISRDSASGTYEVFKEIVVTLDGADSSRDYAPEALRQASNQIILTLVAQSRSAIGYVGLSYLSAEVKPLAIIPLAGGDAVVPTLRSVQDGSYPIARGLYCYTNGEPTGAVKQYLDWVMGPEGQAIVEQLGFVPAGAEE